MLSSQEVSLMAECLVSGTFSCFRESQEMHSHPGRKPEVCRRVLCIRKMRTTPVYPQGNGLVQRFIHTLASADLSLHYKWHLYLHLPLALLCNWTAAQGSSGCTSMLLLLGWELWTPVDPVFSQPPNKDLHSTPGPEYV